MNTHPVAFTRVMVATCIQNEYQSNMESPVTDHKDHVPLVGFEFPGYQTLVGCEPILTQQRTEEYQSRPNF